MRRLLRLGKSLAACGRPEPHRALALGMCFAGGSTAFHCFDVAHWGLFGIANLAAAIDMRML